MTGTLPTQIGSLSNIFGFDLSKNRLTGIIPHNFKQIHSMTFFRLGNNLLTGTIPDIFDNMTRISLIEFSFNKFTGQIPSSIWGLSSLEELILENNELIDAVPDSFCPKIRKEMLKIDNLPWFDRKKVDCQCCGNSPECRIWNNDKITAGGTIRPPCPHNNIHHIDYWRRYRITDIMSNVTFTENTRLGELLDVNLYLSPTGCYEIQKAIDGDSSNQVPLFDTPYGLNHNASSMSLIEQQQCDIVSICGISLDSLHPKRPLLNHLTQLAVPNMKLLHNSTSFTYQAMCWILTEDVLLHEYDDCDGTLLQRYVMALFFISHQDVFMFDDFSHLQTCKWPGITCDINDKFIKQINLNNTNLQGSITTQLGMLQSVEVIDLSSNHLTGRVVNDIGYLTNMKKINMSNNELSGTIAPDIFTNLINLAELDLSHNQLVGDIPRELLQLPSFKHLGLGSNLFGGTLPNDIVYSESLGKLCE